MKDVTLDMPVGQVVAERASRSRVFERLGIDYCCGGRQPLGDACAGRGLDSATVLMELQDSDDALANVETVDWTSASLGELVDHVVTVHHAYLRREMPRLSQLIGRVLNAHGANHPELREISEVFTAMGAELESHMMKEEHILFPTCKALDSAHDTTDLPLGGTVNNPIRVMMSEHQDTGDDLARLRALTNNYTLPPDGCNTYRAILDGLAELEADTHRHIHEENNILFPKASALEEALRRNG